MVLFHLPPECVLQIVDYLFPIFTNEKFRYIVQFDEKARANVEQNLLAIQNFAISCSSMYQIFHSEKMIPFWKVMYKNQISHVSKLNRQMFSDSLLSKTQLQEWYHSSLLKSKYTLPEFFRIQNKMLLFEGSKITFIQLLEGKILMLSENNSTAYVTRLVQWLEECKMYYWFINPKQMDSQNPFFLVTEKKSTFYFKKILEIWLQYYTKLVQPFLNTVVDTTVKLYTEEEEEALPFKKRNMIQLLDYLLQQELRIQNNQIDSFFMECEFVHGILHFRGPNYQYKTRSFRQSESSYTLLSYAATIHDSLLLDFLFCHLRRYATVQQIHEVVHFKVIGRCTTNPVQALLYTKGFAHLEALVNFDTSFRSDRNQFEYKNYIVDAMYGIFGHLEEYKSFTISAIHSQSQHKEEEMLAKRFVAEYYKALEVILQKYPSILDNTNPFSTLNELFLRCSKNINCIRWYQKVDIEAKKVRFKHRLNEWYMGTFKLIIKYHPSFLEPSYIKSNGHCFKEVILDCDIMASLFKEYPKLKNTLCIPFNEETLLDYFAKAVVEVHQMNDFVFKKEFERFLGYFGTEKDVMKNVVKHSNILTTLNHLAKKHAIPHDYIQVLQDMFT